MKRKTRWKRVAFHSAAEAGRLLGAWAAPIVRSQPGYRRGVLMSVNRTACGGWRLFADVLGRWMDASLEDLPERTETKTGGKSS